MLTELNNNVVTEAPQQIFVLVKTYWRRLQCNIFLSSKTSWRHNCKTSCKHVLKTSWKTSWRRLENVLKTSCKTSWRRFTKTHCKYVLKTSWRRLERRKVLRWRRLGKQEMFVGLFNSEHWFAKKSLTWLASSLKLVTKWSFMSRGGIVGAFLKLIKDLRILQQTFRFSFGSHNFSAKLSN